MAFDRWLAIAVYWGGGNLFIPTYFNPYAGGGYFGQYKMIKKHLENNRNPGIWAHIWEYSARAIQWLPTQQGLDGFQKYMRPCALDESSLSIGSVKNGMTLKSSFWQGTFHAGIWCGGGYSFILVCPYYKVYSLNYKIAVDWLVIAR